LRSSAMGDYIPKDRMWLFGMSLNIFGSVMVNFGTNLMKSAHNLFDETEANEIEDSEDDEVKKKPSVFNSKNIWTLGLTIFSVGCLVNFASFAFAAQSLLAALGTVQFVSNVFFAKFVLGEVLTVRIVVATAIIVSGLLLAIMFSNHASETYTSQDLLDLYTPGYFLFLLLLVAVLVIVHSIYVLYTHNEDIGTPLQGTVWTDHAPFSLFSVLYFYTCSPSLSLSLSSLYLHESINQATMQIVH
jgi:magnesium transporter